MPGKGPGPLPGEKTAAPDGAVPAEAAAAVRRWYVRDTELDLPTAAAAARAGSQASLMLLSPDTPSPAADGEAAAAAQAAEQGSKAATKGRKQHNNDPAAAPTHDVFRLQPIWRPSLAATAAGAGSSAAAAADGPPVVRQGSRKQLMHAAAQWRADEKLMRPLLQSRLVVAAPGAAAAAAGEPSGRYGISTLHKEIEAGILQPLEFNGGGGGGGGDDSNGTRPTSPLSVASDNSVFLSVPSSDRATSPNGRGAAPPRRPTASVLSLASSRARSPPPEQDPTATVLVVHRHFENAPDTAAAAAASADSPAARFIEAQNPALLDELLNQDLLLALPEPRILRYNLPWDADKGFSLAREEHKK